MEQKSLRDILIEIIRHLKAVRQLGVMLNEQYGIYISHSFCYCRKDDRPSLYLGRGIDEAAEALGETPVTTKGWHSLGRDFKHNGVDFHQAAEEHSTHFRKAFEKRKEPEIV